MAMVGILIDLLPVIMPVPSKEMFPYPLPTINPLFVRLPSMLHWITSEIFQPTAPAVTVTFPPKWLAPSAPFRSTSNPPTVVLLVTVKLNEEQSQVLFVPINRLPPMV